MENYPLHPKGCDCALCYVIHEELADLEYQLFLIEQAKLRFEEIKDPNYAFREIDS
jgi:hypothetical protein